MPHSRSCAHLTRMHAEEYKIWGLLRKVLRSVMSMPHNVMAGP